MQLRSLDDGVVAFLGCFESGFDDRALCGVLEAVRRFSRSVSKVLSTGLEPTLS